MENGVYRTASGREVTLYRLHVDRTYTGGFIGSYETLTPRVLDNIPAFAAHALRPGKPILVVKPNSMPLPTFRLLAELVSGQGIKTADALYRSCLYVCWFAHDLAGGLDALIESVLAGVDWESNAEEFDMLEDIEKEP